MSLIFIALPSFGCGIKWSEGTQAPTTKDTLVVPLPPAQLRLSTWMTLPSWISRHFVETAASLTAVRIGPAVVLSLPCDLTADLGQQVKAHARARGLTPILAGFANDYIGYCLPAGRRFRSPKRGP